MKFFPAPPNARFGEAGNKGMARLGVAAAMAPRLRVLAVLAALSIAAVSAYAAVSLAPSGLASSAEPGFDPGSLVAPLDAVHETVFEGYARVGAADAWAHTEETEPVVAPLARMGFDLEVPEGTRGLLFRLEWPGGAEMHLMAHGPGPGMPTYMGGRDASGAMCLAVPEAEVAAGVWKVMGHTEATTVGLAFTITSEVTGPEAARILDGAHGHPMRDDMEMEMREPAEC